MYDQDRTEADLSRRYCASLQVFKRRGSNLQVPHRLQRVHTWCRDFALRTQYGVLRSDARGDPAASNDRMNLPPTADVPANTMTESPRWRAATAAMGS